MTVQEWLESTNKYCKEHKVYDIWNIPDNGYKIRYVDTVDTDEHRWYIDAFKVYSITLDDGEHFVGTWEIETLKSEAMSVSDCGSDHILHFVEMEQVPSVSYIIKEEE